MTRYLHHDEEEEPEEEKERAVQEVSDAFVHAMRRYLQVANAENAGDWTEAENQLQRLRRAAGVEPEDVISELAARLSRVTDEPPEDWTYRLLHTLGAPDVRAAWVRDDEDPYELLWEAMEPVLTGGVSTPTAEFCYAVDALEIAGFIKVVPTERENDPEFVCYRRTPAGEARYQELRSEREES